MEQVTLQRRDGLWGYSWRILELGKWYKIEKGIHIGEQEEYKRDTTESSQVSLLVKKKKSYGVWVCSKSKKNISIAGLLYNGVMIEPEIETTSGQREGKKASISHCLPSTPTVDIVHRLKSFLTVDLRLDCLGIWCSTAQASFICFWIYFYAYFKLL